ncbi:MAG TPA: beta-propeller fold lactonase family protein, partial [Aquaticitalea sp.]|nr:beta-propeller fold lactonase family protein [Aquaticitalea sp.]
MKHRLIAIPMILLMMACNERTEDIPGLTLYVGTYTSGESEGIYSMEFNPSSGELSAPRLIAELPNPSFLAQSEDGRHLYAVQETDDFDALGGGVSAFGHKDGEW